MKKLIKILCGSGVLCALMVFAPAAHAADPVAVEIHYQSGVKFFKRGLYERAIQEFEKTLVMDAEHGEARAYLDKVRELQETHRPAEARASKNADIKKLYKEGRRLYKAKEYEEAIEVFNKVLALKPIDDFASYYRERCEMFISKRLAREKKIEERRERLEEKKELQEAARRKKEARRRKVKRRQEATPPPSAEIPKAAVEKPVPVETSKMTAAELARQEKLSDKELRRQEKIRAHEAKRAEAKRLREEKLREKEERYQEKLRLKEERQAEAEERRDASRLTKEEKRQEALARRESHLKAKEAKVAEARARKTEARARAQAKKMARKELLEARRRNKERFLEGVKAYGRKEYEEAIAAFREVVRAEQETGPLYTRSAGRLIDKARKRLDGIGKDAKI